MQASDVVGFASNISKFELSKTREEREKARELELETKVAQARAKLAKDGIDVDNCNDKEIKLFLKDQAAILTEVDIKIICAITGQRAEDITTENDSRKALPRDKLIDIDTSVDDRYTIKDADWFNKRFFRVRDYFGQPRVCHFTKKRNPITGAVHREFVAQTHDAFLTAYCDAVKEAKTFIVDTKNAYQCIVCKPDNEVGANEMNVWRGFSVEPQEGDVSVFTRYVEDVVCNGDKELSEYLLNLMAYGIQYPFRFWGVYVLLYSPEEGTGKDTLSNIYGSLFVDYFMTNRPDRIIGKFTEQIAFAPVVKLEDTTIRARDMPTLRSTINSIKLDIEGKGIKGGNVDNMMKFFWTTNELPKGVAATDRRALAIQVSPKKKDDKAYWDALYRWKDNGGLGALLYYLQKRELSGFSPYPRPITRLLKILQDENLMDHEKAMLELLQEGEFPFLLTKNIRGTSKATYLIDGKMTTIDFRSRYQDKYPGIRVLSDNKLTDLFKAIGAKRGRRGGGIGATWEFPTLEECRKNWDAGRNTKEEWNSIDRWFNDSNGTKIIDERTAASDDDIDNEEKNDEDASFTSQNNGTSSADVISILERQMKDKM